MTADPRTGEAAPCSSGATRNVAPPGAAAPHHTRARLASSGAALLGYLALTLLMTYPLVRQFATAIPGDSFDGWQNYWNLWWVKTALVEKFASPFYTDILYHPTGVSLLFHTLNVFNGITFLPVQLAFGLIPAYNAVVVFSFAIGGVGAYLLARYVLGPGSSRLAAFVAGAIFTFSPYHIAHLLGHMQLISLEWLPFFALYLLRAAETRRRREIALATLFLVLVAVCDWYYVFYCLIFSAVVAVWVLVARSRRDSSRFGNPTGLWTIPAVWLLTALVLSPLLIPMVRQALSASYMVPDPGQTRTFSADLLAFVTPQGFHPLWGEWARGVSERFTATISEYTVFAGYTVLALAAVAVFARWRGRRGMKGLWVSVALVFFILSLGPALHVGGGTALLPGGGEIPLPYALIAGLPFLDIMRSISRLDVMLMLALGVLVAGGLTSVAGWLNRRAPAVARAIPAVALALVLFEFLPIPYPTSPPDTPAWYTTLAADERAGAVLNLPANWDRPGYLLYQTEHGKPLTIAYISREDPRTFTERAPVLQHFRHLGPDIVELDLAVQGQQVLSDLGVRWVALDRYKMPGGPEREVTEALAREIFGGQEPVFEDERLTVYEVTRGAGGGPYVVLGEGWGPFNPQTRSREVLGSAEVLVMSPGTSEALLVVTVSPDSGAASRRKLGDAYDVQLSLTPGTNALTIDSQPGERVVISGLKITP
jgi:hypothetical protein